MVLYVSYHRQWMAKHYFWKCMPAGLENTCKNTRSVVNSVATTGGGECGVTSRAGIEPVECVYLDEWIDQSIRPPLVPLLVTGAFDNVGLEVI